MFYKRLLAVLLLLGLTVSASPAQGTLFDRLGGDRGMTALIDDWYGRLTADPQLADRFAGPDKAYLHTQYLTYFETMTGGPRVYHGRDVAGVHRHLRVTPQEWDLTVGHMQESLDRFHVNPRTQREFLNQIASLRRDIVKASTPSSRTLYDRLGGEPALRAVVDDFFDQLISDPSMADRFTGTNISAIKGEVVTYLGQATGGPQTYDGRDMKSVHWRMHITPEEWEATMSHLQTALDRNHVSGQEATELIGIIQSTRSQIVHDR